MQISQLYLQILHSWFQSIEFSVIFNFPNTRKSASKHKQTSINFLYSIFFISGFFYIIFLINTFLFKNWYKTYNFIFNLFVYHFRIDFILSHLGFSKHQIIKKVRSKYQNSIFVLSSCWKSWRRSNYHCKFPFRYLIIVALL